MKESAYKVKSVCKDAVISCVIGGISILLMILSVLISYLYEGKGPVMVGLLGIGSLMLAVGGLIFSVSAWKSTDGGFRMKQVSGFLNVIPIIMAVTCYVLGWI